MTMRTIGAYRLGDGDGVGTEVRFSSSVDPLDDDEKWTVHRRHPRFDGHFTRTFSECNKLQIAIANDEHRVDPIQRYLCCYHFTANHTPCCQRYLRLPCIKSMASK